MKKILLLIALISSFFSKAQNYQCLQSGVKHYFINENNYLRGIKIDSVKYLGDTIIYYPFRTIRTFYPSYGDTVGSWLGKKVVQLPNGTFLFDDMYGDTVFIRTQANLGDNWLFYNNTTIDSFMATVIAVDTMTILGMLDSIKTININSYHLGFIDSINSVVNNFELIVSKNNGFVKVFDLYTFPYVVSVSSTGYLTFTEDAYLHHLNMDWGGWPQKENQTFNRVSYHNPTGLEMYNLSVGDMFANHRHTDRNCGDEYITDCYHYDSVISRIALDSFHVQYAMHHTFECQTELISSIAETSFYYPPTIYTTIDTLNADTSLVFPSLMPEEIGMGQFVYYFYPLDTSFCYLSPAYSFEKIDLFEQCQVAAKLKQRFLPLSDSTICFSACGSTPFDETGYDDMYYALKNGYSCDSIILIALGTAKPVKPDEVLIFPNPVQDELTIKASKDIDQVTITNILGQTIFAQAYNSWVVQIPVGNFSPGVYFVRINGATIRKFVKE